MTAAPSALQSGAALTVFDSALKNNAAAQWRRHLQQGWISLARVTFENNTSTDGAGMIRQTAMTAVPEQRHLQRQYRLGRGQGLEY